MALLRIIVLVGFARWCNANTLKLQHRESNFEVNHSNRIYIGSMNVQIRNKHLIYEEFNSNSSTQVESEESSSPDTFTTIWYVGILIFLIVLSVAMVVAECCCKKPEERSSRRSSVFVISSRENLPPPYYEFQPPTYESLFSEDKNLTEDSPDVHQITIASPNASDSKVQTVQETDVSIAICDPKILDTFPAVQDELQKHGGLVQIG